MRPVMSRLLCPLSYGPGTAHTLLRAVASAHIGGDTAPVRTLALLVVLAPALALADEAPPAPDSGPVRYAQAA